MTGQKRKGSLPLSSTQLGTKQVTRKRMIELICFVNFLAKMHTSPCLIRNFHIASIKIKMPMQSMCAILVRYLMCLPVRHMSGIHIILLPFGNLVKILCCM